MRAFKWLSGGVDAALAVAYWAVVAHSEIFYPPYGYRFPLAYGGILAALMGLKIWLAQGWLKKDWAGRHPFLMNFVSLFFTAYVIFFSLVLASIFVPGGGIGRIDNYAYLPLVPFAFFLYGSPVVVPLWLGFTVGNGCCLRRMV